MQLPEGGTSVRKYVGVFQDLCMIYILLCAFVAEYNLLELYLLFPCGCEICCWCERRGSEEKI